MVLIDSPGGSREPHWSADYCERLAARLHGEGAQVERLHATRGAPAPLHQVATTFTDVPEEVALANALRATPAHVVVHAGAGARGSPNLLWLAARLGSACVGVVRMPEVVCQRGDLVDRDDAACATFDDPARCAWCCRRSFFQKARPADFLNRMDLVVASLQVCEEVWTIGAGDGDSDRAALEGVGVPRRALRSASDDEAVERIAAALPAIARTVVPT